MLPVPLSSPLRLLTQAPTEVPPQEPVLPLAWTDVWLAAGGLVLLLVVLAAGYLLVRRRWERLRHVLRHPLLEKVDRQFAGRLPRLWRVVRERLTVHQWHGLALTVALVVAFAGFYLFALVAESWTDEEALYAFDRRVNRWLVAMLTERVTAFMQYATHLGDGAVLAALGAAVGVWLLVRRHYRYIVALVLAPGVGSALVVGLKELFGRARPASALAADLGHSFPSGHAFSAVSFYGFLIYLTWRLATRDLVRVGLTVPLVLLILLVGLSRIVLRVHWVSDVAGGFAFGLAWLVCSIVLARALQALGGGHPRLRRLLR